MQLLHLQYCWTELYFTLHALSNSVILFIALLVQLIRKHAHGKRKENNVANYLQSFFAIMTLLTCVSYSTQRMISSYGVGNCLIHTILSVILWLGVKFWMYLFFLSRIHNAFNNSAYQLNSKWFKVLYIVVILQYIILNIIYGALAGGLFIYVLQLFWS